MPLFGPNKVREKMITPKTILVYVCEDLMGDALLKLPFVNALRIQFPKAHITWCAGHAKTFYKGAFRELVDGYLDEVIELPLGRCWKELFKPSPLKQRTFDLIIDTQRDLLPTLCLKKIHHAYFLSRTLSCFFSDFKSTKKTKWDGHLSDRLIALLSLMGGRVITNGFPLPDLSTHRKAVSSFFKKKKRYVGFAPGAGQAKKRWPLDRFVHVALKFEELQFVPVFILGPSETGLYKILKKRCSRAIFPLQEKPELLKSPLNTSAIGYYLDFCLLNDAGAGHLMALSPTHLVCLFGPTDAKKVHPVSNKLTIIKAQKFGTTQMEGIPFQDVLDNLKDIEKSL